MSEQGYQGCMSGGVCGSPKRQGLDRWLHRSTSPWSGSGCGMGHDCKGHYTVNTNANAKEQVALGRGEPPSKVWCPVSGPGSGENQNLVKREVVRET
jgi:hypothetical protein